MTVDFPRANARLAAVARSWAEGEVSHEAWRKVRNGILSELVRSHQDCAEGDAPPVASASIRKPATIPHQDSTSPSLPIIGAPPVPAEREEAPQDQVLILALLLLATIAGAIFWFYIY